MIKVKRIAAFTAAAWAAVQIVPQFQVAAGAGVALAAGPPARVPADLAFPSRAEIPADDIIARVGRRVVTKAEFNAEATSVTWKHLVQALPQEQVKARVIKKLVENQLVLLQAERDGTMESPPFRAIREALQVNVIARFYVDREVREKVEVSDAEVDAALPRSDVMANFSILRMSTREKADEALAALKAGRSLADLIGAGFSPDQVGEGKTGLIPKGSGFFPPEAEKSLFSLAEGEVSGVFQGNDGFFYIARAERRVAISEADRQGQREAVRSGLRKRRMEKVVPEFRQRLTVEEGIAVDYKAIQEMVAQGCAAAGACGERSVGTDGRKSHSFGELEAYARLIYYLAKEPAPPFQETPWIELAGLMLFERAVADKAVAEGFLDDPMVKASYEMMFRQVFFTYLRETLIADVAVTDAEIGERYRRDEVRLTVPARRRLSQIVVATSDEAVALYHRLQKGEDFGALAKKHSTHESAAKGGDLGFQHLENNSLPAGLVRVGFNLDLHEVSQPYRSDEGYHLIRVEEIIAARTPTLEEAAPTLREMIMKEKEEARINEYLEKARADVEVKIDEEKLKRLPLL